MEPCPVCFGKGEWPAISDREWAAHAGRRGCDYVQRCGFCRGVGEVKSSRLSDWKFPITSEETGS